MTQPLDQAVAKLKKNQREINAFHRTFKSEDGKEVLALIEQKFQLNRPAFLPSKGVYCPYSAAIRDGQREVILYIHEVLSRTMEGDGNIETAAPAVKTE